MWERRTSESDGFCWPTPTTNEGSTNRSVSAGSKIRFSLGALVRRGFMPHTAPTLVEKRGTQKYEMTSGDLNPTWVEWLMGFPSEWTELNALGMQWCPPKREKRSKD
jgi:hypothetical protein